MTRKPKPVMDQLVMQLKIANALWGKLLGVDTQRMDARAHHGPIVVRELEKIRKLLQAWLALKVAPCSSDKGCAE
jgi:hypothetical protein